MVNFLDRQADARRVAVLLAEYDRRLQALERSTQASHTSIEGGAIEVFDKNGTHRGSVGMQPDGTVALVPTNSPPPPTPTAPRIEPALAGLVVAWDGLWDNKYFTPNDFALVQVHVGPDPNFTPGPTTLAGSINDVHGGSLAIAIEGYAAVWVRFVGVNTAAVTGPPSSSVQGTPRQAVPQDLIDGIVTETKLAQKAVTEAKIALGAVGPTTIADNAVTTPKILAGAITTDKLVALAITAEKIASLAITTDKLNALAVTADKLAVNSVTATKILAGSIDATHIKAGAITADRLALGTTGNLIADPSFEGEITTARITTAGATWSAVPAGNGSAKALQVAATSATPLTQGITLAVVPVLPGESLYLSVDHHVSTDWAGDSVRFSVEWQDSAGASLSFHAILDKTPPRGTWARLTGQQRAPSGAVRARLYLQTYLSTAGSVRFDNAEARAVVGSRGTGSRAELSPEGLRLFADDGNETVSLVSGQRNFLTLTTDGLPVATIDDRGNGRFADLAVAGNLTVGGDSLSNVMAYAPRGLVAFARQTEAVTGGASEYGYVELSFKADPARMYRVVLDAFVTASTEGGEVHVSFRDGGSTTPSVSSPILQTRVFELGGSAYRPVRVELVKSGAEFGPGLRRLLATFHAQWAPAGLTVTLFGRADVPGHMYIEDIGPALPDTGLYNPGGGIVTPPKQTLTKYYNATWSGSYANRGSYNSFYGNKMMAGYFSSNNGMQASLVGFNLGDDLAGAQINEASLYLYFDHWFYASGGTAIIRAHGHGARPGSFSSDSDSVSEDFGRNEGRWVDISRIFDSTNWRGIALDPNNSNGTYYGRARGASEDYAPQLRVTYTK
ncbi:hypothetical protein [Streptomyces virginiae]|uniref:hypothetical protein n=1 Tax=Streptomyces virginiae TaxID=1961 RepID=UPI00365777A3